MHEVYVCFACRVPLVEGCFGVFCCELCKLLWSRSTTTTLRGIPARLHSDDCIERLREMLMHRRPLLLRTERVIPTELVTACGDVMRIE
jgi:hypothetical protein